MMDWLVRYHEAVLLWIAAIMMLACSTTFYHAPVMGILVKASAIVFVVAGVVVLRVVRREKEYDD